MRAALKRRNMLRAACLALAAACCACTSASGSGPAGRAAEAGQHGAVITVGSFDFPESVLLADLYAGALAAKGFPVRVLPDLGPREQVDPALMSGLLQVVPEYSGSALEFVSVGRLSATSDAAATSTALAEQVAGRGLVAGRPSAAQDGNVIVVTAATAARNGLRSIAGLARWAPRLVFGGPPECPERVYCLRAEADLQAPVIGLLIWARIADQRQRSFVMSYPGRPPGFQDREDIRGSMHAGRRQPVAGGGQTSVPWGLSRSVIDSVGPAGAGFARNADYGLVIYGVHGVVVGAQINHSGVLFGLSPSPCARWRAHAGSACPQGHRAEPAWIGCGGARGSGRQTHFRYRQARGL